MMEDSDVTNDEVQALSFPQRRTCSPEIESPEMTSQVYEIKDSELDFDDEQNDNETQSDDGDDDIYGDLDMVPNAEDSEFGLAVSESGLVIGGSGPVCEIGGLSGETCSGSVSDVPEEKTVDPMDECMDDSALSMGAPEIHYSGDVKSPESSGAPEGLLHDETNTNRDDRRAPSPVQAGSHPSRGDHEFSDHEAPQSPQTDDDAPSDDDGAHPENEPMPHDANPPDGDSDTEQMVEKAPSEKGSMEEGEVEDGEIEDDDEEAQAEVQNVESDVAKPPVDPDSESLDEEELAGMSKRARKRYRKRKREAEKKEEKEGEPKKRHKRSRHVDEEKKSPHEDHKRRRRHHSDSADERTRNKSPVADEDEERNYEYDQYFEDENTPGGEPGLPEDYEPYYDDHSSSDDYYDNGPEPADGSLASVFGDYMDKDGNIRLDLPDRRRAKRLRLARGGGRGRGRGMPADILALARHGGMAVQKSRLLLQNRGENKGIRPRRDEDPICKVYKETGVCKLGEECPFSHDCLRTEEKRQEVCKFFLMDTCAKGDRCTYLHSELPCKYWHTGFICHAGDKCKYSHEKLTEDGKALLKKVLREKPLGANPGPKRPDWSGSDDEKEKVLHHRLRPHRDHDKRDHRDHKDHHRGEHKDKGRESKDGRDKRREDRDHRSKDKERKDKGRESKDKFKDKSRRDKENRERRIIEDVKESDSRESVDEEMKIADEAEEILNEEFNQEKRSVSKEREDSEPVEEETVEEQPIDLPERDAREKETEKKAVTESEERELKDGKGKDEEDKDKTKVKDRDPKDDRRDRKDRERDKDRKDRERRDRDRERRDRDPKDRKRDRERDDHRHDEKKPRRDALLGSAPQEESGKVPSLLDIRVFPDASPPRPAGPPPRRERRGRDREWGRGRGRGRGRGHRNYDGPYVVDGPYEQPPYDGPYEVPFEGPYEMPYDAPMPYDTYDQMRPFDMPPMGPPVPAGPPGPPGHWNDIGGGPHGPPGPQMSGMPFDLPGVPPGMPANVINMMATAIASAIRGNVPQKEEDNPYSHENIAAQVAERLKSMKEAHIQGQNEPQPETSIQGSGFPGSAGPAIDQPMEIASGPPIQDPSEPDAEPTIPDNLPPVQRQLMMRLQQNQKNNLPQSDRNEEEENWYSSDDDESKNRSQTQMVTSHSTTGTTTGTTTQPPANIMDILKTITKPTEDGSSNPTMARVLSLLRDTQPGGASQQPPQGPVPSSTFGQTGPVSQAPFGGTQSSTSRDPRQRLQSKSNAQPLQQFNSSFNQNQNQYSDSPMSPPHTANYQAFSQEWFIVQGLTNQPVKWNMIPCDLDLFNKPSLPSHVNPSESIYKDDPRLAHYRNTAPLRGNSGYNPANSFGNRGSNKSDFSPNSGYGDAGFGGSRAFGMGQNAGPPRSFAPPIPAALLTGMGPRSEAQRLGFEPMMNYQPPRGPRPSSDPRSRNDPRAKSRSIDPRAIDPRSPRDECPPLPRLDEPSIKTESWTPKFDPKDPLTQMPKALSEPPRIDESCKMNAETSDEEKLSHRNDPRFKRRKSANTEAERDPLVSRKRTMEYNSPLSGGAKEQSSTDAYSAYNRPRTRPQTNNNNNINRNSPVIEERSTTPLPLTEHPLDPLDPDLMLGPETQPSGSLKDVFNQIDPAASPFC